MFSIDKWTTFKAYINFTEEDETLLLDMKERSEFFVDEVIVNLYDILLNSPLTAEYFKDEAVLNSVKASQVQYFNQLFSGEYGEDYLLSRVKMAEVHKKLELPISLFIATYSHYFMLIRSYIFEYVHDEEHAFLVLDALAKLITLDEMVSAEIYSR